MMRNGIGNKTAVHQEEQRRDSDTGLCACIASEIFQVIMVDCKRLRNETTQSASSLRE